MNRLISLLSSTLFLVMLFVAAQAVRPEQVQAQAEYTTGDDYKVAWTLDPRDDAVLFPRGPAFGARSVLTGMDLDGDGNKEILFTTDETLAPSGPDPGFLDIFLYENNGDDSYEYVWHYTHDEGSNSLPPLAYGDIDSDGNPEIYFGIPTINDNEDIFIFEAEAGVFPATPTVSLIVRNDPAVDFRPSGFQLTDVDNDGDIELISQSRTSGNRELVVLSLATAQLDAFATFTEEFQAGEALLGGGGTYDVMVVDFDGDGNNEIWYNTWDNWSMTIFEVTGPDTYVLQADLNAVIPVDDPGSFNSHDLFFDDFDGDGDMEGYLPMTDGVLYYIDSISDISTITVDDIQRVGQFDLTGSSRGADVGDLDGDGLTDIVASHGTQEKVSLIEHDGVGSRADSTSYSWDILLDSSGGSQERYYPMRISDDLDGDGRNEVVITNLFASDVGQDMIIILEYDGPPAEFVVADGYQWAWSLDPRDDAALFPRGPAFGARSVLTGMDLDGDGNKEILFTTDETLAPSGPDPGFLDIFLYENNGDDSYEYVWHYTHDEGSNSLPPLAYGDIDSDGNPEIYFGIPTINDNEDIFIFEAEAGVFPATPTVSLIVRNDPAVDFRPSGFQLTDVDNDGDIELISQSRTSGNRELVVLSLATAQLDAFATFTEEFQAGEALLGGGGTYDVMVVDFDGDGNNEIWYNTWDNWSMTIFEVTGPDTYVLQADLNAVIPVDDPGSFNSHDLFFDDFDGDGNMEGYLPMTDGVLYYIDSISDISTITVDDIQRVGQFDLTGSSRGADVGDLDGDGLTDIVASHGTQEKVSLIEHDGVGSRADSTSYSWDILLDSSGGSQERYYPMRISDDLDGDGRNEVVITNLFASDTGQPMIIVLEYTGMTTAVDDYAELPDRYVLDQNYPNPFNPTTSIEFELPAAATVYVRVYNVMGQLVRTLVDGEMKEAGRHGVVWDGRNVSGTPVASGTYLYTLDYGKGRKARTMILLK